MIIQPEILSVVAANTKDENIDQSIKNCIAHCRSICPENPVETFRVIQKAIVTGRALEIEDQSVALVGGTNEIFIDRSKVLQTAIEELEMIRDFRKTLDVSFYGEMAQDFGGPRKEFFRLCLNLRNLSIADLT